MFRALLIAGIGLLMASASTAQACGRVYYSAPCYTYYSTPSYYTPVVTQDYYITTATPVVTQTYPSYYVAPVVTQSYYIPATTYYSYGYTPYYYSSGWGYRGRHWGWCR
jgi:hypothetical protein